MDIPVSEIIAFLLGVASGAGGKYFADKYTDQRKEKESVAREKRKFKDLRKMMPELFDEMKVDIAGDKGGLVREFFVLPNEGVTVSSAKPRFSYFEEQHQDLRNKFSLLSDAGFLADVSVPDTTIFRMSDKFVELVRTL